MKERRDFKKWVVDLVYEAQEGCCANCGASLEQTGFHRHHKDNNPKNNSIDNLELLCPRCHYAQKGTDNPYTRHQAQEKRILEKLNQLIDLALENKLSGATMERLLDAMSMSLKISRRVTEVDYGLEHIPPSIKMQRYVAERKLIQDAFLEGFKEGAKSVILLLRREENEGEQNE